MPFLRKVTPGATRDRSSMLCRPFTSSASWLNAVTLIGTSIRRSVRRSAVTTTSCSPVVEAAPASAACAQLRRCAAAPSVASSTAPSASCSVRLCIRPPPVAPAPRGAGLSRPRFEPQRLRLRRARIDLVAAEPGCQHFSIRHIRRVASVGERQDIPVEHDEICGLADLERAGHVSQVRSEEHTSELQSRLHLVCRLLLEKKKKKQ